MRRSGATGEAGVFVVCRGVMREQIEAAHELVTPGALEGLRLLVQSGVSVIALEDEPASQDVLGESLEHVAETLRWPATADLSPVGQRLRVQRLTQAVRRHGLCPSASFVVSDRWADLSAAAALGCQPILVMTGVGRDAITWPPSRELRAQTWYVADFAAAALAIQAQQVQGMERAEPRAVQTVAWGFSYISSVPA